MVDIGKNGTISITTVDGINPASQLRLVVYHIIYRVLYIWGGPWFLPSTVPPILYWRLEEKAMEGDDVLAKRWANSRGVEESQQFLRSIWITLQWTTVTYHTPKKAPTWVDDFPQVGYCYFQAWDIFLRPTDQGWRRSAWRTTTDTFHFASRYSCSRWNRKAQPNGRRC